MWIQVGVAGGVVLALVAMLRLALGRRSQKIDVGPVSDAWLAEHRARERDVY